MVSGLVTSPWDHDRIFSGEARLIRMLSKSAMDAARSYGLDLIKVLPSRWGGKLAADYTDLNQRNPRNPRLVPFPFMHSVSVSSARRRDRGSAARESER